MSYCQENTTLQRQRHAQWCARLCELEDDPIEEYDDEERLVARIIYWLRELRLQSQEKTCRRNPP